VIETPSKDARLWAVIAHVSPFVLMGGVPFGSVLGPLIVYLLKKDEDPFIALHAKESLNFHISLAIYAVVGFIGMFVAFFATIAGLPAHPTGTHGEAGFPGPPWFVPLIFPFGPFLVFFAALVAVIVLMVIASMTANRGEPYRYPLTIRFVR
jgi:uncharacterized protein